MGAGDPCRWDPRVRGCPSLAHGTYADAHLRRRQVWSSKVLTRCSVRELEQVTGMSQPLVSYHLRELRQAGLVEASAAGRSNRYRLANADLDELAGLIGSLHAAMPAIA